MVISEAGLQREMEKERIEEIAMLAKPSIAAIGLGGAGCNILSWVKQRGLVGGKIIALNTDANHLSTVMADRRILIGEKICRGLGSGGYPAKGEEALRENLEQVKKEIAGTSIIFVVAGLGGGTGTGASYALAEELQNFGGLLIGVVTLPFEVERVRSETARKGLQRLKKSCDTVVAIDNNKLVKVAGNLAFRQALGVANELVGVFVKDITETITTASLINLDYMDLRAIMEKRGLAAIGVGYGAGEEKVEKAVKIALEGQLLDIEDITKSHGVLIHVSGGSDMTLEEVTRAGEMVTKSLPPYTKIVWGARVSDEPEMEGKVHVMVILTGVQSKFLSQPKRRLLPSLKIF